MDEQFDGHARTVFPQVFLLIPDWLAGCAQFLQFPPLYFLPFRRGERLGPVEGAEFLGAVAGQLLEGRVDQPEMAIQIPHAEGLRRMLDNIRQELLLPLGFPQRQFLIVSRRLPTHAAVKLGRHAPYEPDDREESQANSIYWPLDPKTRRGGK